MILVAGATGIIGRFLIRKIKSLDLDYIGIGVESEKPSDSHYQQVDLTNEQETLRFIASHPRFDKVIFLTGLAHKKGRKGDFELFESVNYCTLVNLLAAMNKEKKEPEKVIFASTISVYGERMSTDIYTESMTLCPCSPYALTKIKAEDFLRESITNQCWILRFAPVYSDDFQLNIRRRTMIGKYKYLVGQGTQYLSLLHINNIWISIEAIFKDRLPVGTYNLADDTAYTYRELAAIGMGKPKLRIPRLAVFFIYLVGIITRNCFMKENSTKLLSSNIISTEKISDHIKLTYHLPQDWN